MKWIASMMLVGLVACGDAPVSGDVTVRTADGASVLVMPDECAESGSDRGAGVELRDEAGWSFHFRHDSRHGPSMRLSSPAGDEVAVLAPSACEVFRGELRRRTELEDGVVHVTYGHLDLRCSLPDGVTVEGELDFDQCLDR